MKKQATPTTSGPRAGRRMARAPLSLRAQVLLAARQRCDDMGDGPEAREQMKRDVLATPDALLPELLKVLTSVRIERAHFLSTTPPTTKGARP